MPIYIYRCQDCANTFEELIFSAEAASALACPKCGSRQLARQPAVFATTSGAPDAPPCCGQGGCGSCSFDN